MKAYESALATFQKLADANPTAVEFQRHLAGSHTNVGLLFRDAGKPEEAMKAYDQALVIRQRLTRDDPESPDKASDLGLILNNIAGVDLEAGRYQEARARLREAVACQRKALAAYPGHPYYRRLLDNNLFNLRIAAQGLHDAKGLAEAERELAKLRDSDPAIAALLVRLAAIIKGTEQPRDEADQLVLAQLAYDKSLNVTAARLWGAAVTANPRLGDDRFVRHRYNAACAAALAGCGQGKDEPPPDEAAREKLRIQALEWLDAELAAWSKLLSSDAAKAGPLIVKELAHWHEDTDLAGIRDAKEIAKLPEAERLAFQRLWSDVDGLLTRARGGKSSGKLDVQ